MKTLPLFVVVLAACGAGSVNLNTFHVTAAIQADLPSACDGFAESTRFGFFPLGQDFSECVMPTSAMVLTETLTCGDRVATRAGWTVLRDGDAIFPAFSDQSPDNNGIVSIADGQLVPAVNSPDAFSTDADTLVVKYNDTTSGPIAERFHVTKVAVEPQPFDGCRTSYPMW